MVTSFPRFSPTLVQFWPLNLCHATPGERVPLSLPALRDRERGARTGLLPTVRFRVCKNFGIKARCIAGAIFPFVLTCCRVFFFFSLSGILLITLLCYALYVNLVIQFVISPIFTKALRVYQRKTCNGVLGSRIFFSVDYAQSPIFPQGRSERNASARENHPTRENTRARVSLALLICQPSGLQVVCLYCNYYFFALCRNLVFFVR